MTTAVPPVVTDPASRYPELARLRAAAASGDLGTVLAALDALRDSDPDEYAELSSVVVLEDGLDAPLEQHLQESPDDRGARTLWAHRVIAAIEGGALDGDPAAQVRDAEHWLQRMCAEDPTDPHPWTLRLATSRLLGLGAVETRRRYGRLLEARPGHLAGQRWMLDGLGPRPGGSWDEALAFARRTAAEAPPGSPAGTLVVAAHLGRWVEESGGGNLYYLARPEVVGEAETASDRWLAGPVTDSVATVRPRTELAVALGLAGSRARAVAHFRALGQLVAPGPWEAARQHHGRLEALRAQALTADDEPAEPTRPAQPEEVEGT
jgi:hypothetical protein